MKNNEESKESKKIPAISFKVELFKDATNTRNITKIVIDLEGEKKDLKGTSETFLDTFQELICHITGRPYRRPYREPEFSQDTMKGSPFDLSV